MNVRKLTPALRHKAEKELNENVEQVADNIAKIREWMLKQPNMKNIRPPDQWILTFLRGAKFNLERCKEKIEIYENLKTSIPEFYENRDPFCDEVQEILKLGVMLPLRKVKEVDAPRVCITRIGLLDTSKHKLCHFLKVVFMIIEIMMLEDDNFTVAGMENLVDMSNIKIGILLQWTPALAKKTVSCFSKALPMRLKGVHIMNTITGFEAAYSILRIFLVEKLRKRFHVYGKGNTALIKVASNEILPAEYGGNNDSFDELRDYWKSKVESYRDWFMQKKAYGDGVQTL